MEKIWYSIINLLSEFLRFPIKWKSEPKTEMDGWESSLFDGEEAVKEREKWCGLDTGTQKRMRLHQCGQHINFQTVGRRRRKRGIGRC